MGYGKLNTNGTLISANKQHEGFVELSSFAQDSEGNYYEFYLPDMVDGMYVPDMEAVEDEARAEARTKAITTTQEQLDTLTADYPKFEKDTFWVQELEARGYLLGSTASTPFIDEMCTARGVSKAEMVAKIISNADALKSATATLIGQYQAGL